MAQSIPLSTYPFFNIRVDLTGSEYQMVFRYLSRSQTWIADMYTAEGSPLFVGKPCLLSVDLLAGLTDPARPPGQLFFVDSANSGIEAGLDDLGTRVSLRYLEAGESNADFI